MTTKSILALCLLCLTVHAQPLSKADIYTASWERFDDYGKIAANGKPFDPNLMTCATRRWPLGTMLQVTDSHNGLSVIVRVTDVPAKRFGTTRIDLSPKAFEVLNGLDLGTCPVNVRALMGK